MVKDEVKKLIKNDKSNKNLEEFLKKVEAFQILVKIYTGAAYRAIGTAMR